MSTREISDKIEKSYDFEVKIPEYAAPPDQPPMKCDKCGGELVLVKIEIQDFTLYLETG